MTGTSMDGIDVALARIDGSGLEMRAELVAHESASLGELAPRLRAAAQELPLPAAEFARLALELGHLHATVCSNVCAASGAKPDLASIHGQTIYHRPPFSWQLINPWPIAKALRCPVVYDLRGADIAEGGQGAPLTPLADWVLFRGSEGRAIVNLGGFANATIIPADSSRPDLIEGLDLCPCNQLLDCAARAVLRAPYDADGAAAMQGESNDDLLAALLPRLAQGASGRSLGTGDESSELVAELQRQVPANTLLATLSEAVGLTIVNAMKKAASVHRIDHVLLAGGGAHHARLVRTISACMGRPVSTTSVLGVPVGLREALGWAVLGALAQDGARATLPLVTGRASQSLADGSWCFPERSREAFGAC
jgi:1,6-anhydro-N-acetylmuramate kinase